MKKIFLFIILFAALSGNCIWGQSVVSGTSTYRAGVSGNVGLAGSSCGDAITGGLQWIVLRLANGANITVVRGPTAVYPNGNGQALRNTTFSGTYDFTKSNTVTLMTIRTSQRGSTWLDPCTGTTYTNADRTVNSVCMSTTYNFSNLGLNQPGSVTLSIYPVIQLDNPVGTNVYISDEEYQTIALTDNIVSSYYNWEYSVGDASSFQSVPYSYNYKPVLNLKGKDFLPANDFGKNVYFRVNMGYCGGISRVSDTIVFTYRKTAPHIVNTVTTDTKCFGSADGSIKVYLDRALIAGERLVIYGIPGNPEITSLDSDNSFTLENMSSGTYTVQISGTYQDAPMYSDGATHKKTVAVNSPPILSYSLAGASNISCFGGSDGSIRIAATGGVGGYKLYLKKSPEADYGTALAFTSPVETTVGNLLPGVYDFYAVDANGCEIRDLYGSIITIQVTLTQPEKALEFSLLSSIDPSGFGLSNGSITIEGDGGTADGSGNYTIIWRNKQTGAILTTVTNETVNGKFRSILGSVPAGTYTVRIEDAKGCNLTQEYTLEQPQALTVSIENTLQILCNGDSNGELVAHAGGGVLNSGEQYIYQWYKKEGAVYQPMPSYTDSIAAGLVAGNYRVEVKDRSRIPNILTADFSLNEPALLTTTMTTQNVSCYGGNNGFIKIQVSGGAGNYTLFYKNKDDDNYGSTTVNAAGNTFLLNNLFSGEYRLYITDGNNCTAPIAGASVALVEIKQPAKAIAFASVAIEPVSGYGRSDGTVSLKIEGGTPYATMPYYIVSWKDSAGSAVASAESLDAFGVFTSEITNLPQGDYTVEVKDQNYAGAAGACYLTATFTVEQPAPLSVSLENTGGIFCYGETTGILVAHAKGGIPNVLANLPYKYQWYRVDGAGETPVANETDSIIKNLPAGSYKVKVEDYSSPVNTVESPVFAVTQPTLLTTAAAHRNISCFGLNDGFIHIAVSGGVGNYKLFYKKDADTAYGEKAVDATDNTFYLDNLYAGKYILYIVDGNNCYAKINGQDSCEFNLSQPDAPLAIASVTRTDVSGYGLSNGSISIAIEGGTPYSDNSYLVVWKNASGQTLPATASFTGGKYASLLENVPAGEYSVEVRDSNYAIAYTDANSSCFVSETFLLTQPEKLLASIEESRFISCNGMSDGQLTVHAGGGIKNPASGSLPYKYIWYKEGAAGMFSVLTNQTDSVLSNIPVGTYRVEIEDYSRIANTVSVTYFLAEPDLLQATATEINITCGQTATVSVAATGGTKPYTYQWSTGDETQSVANVPPGRYLVFVGDSRGCETTAIAKVSMPEGLAVSGTVSHPVCYGSATGSIRLQVAGGTAPYAYRWSNGAVSKDLTGIAAGQYSVTVTDKDGCSFTNNFTLTEPEALTVNLGEDRTLCNGQSLTLAPVVADPATRFSWSGPDAFSAVSPQITVNKAGAYRLTITDSKGCQASDEINVKVSNVDISSEIFVSTEVFRGDTVVIADISNPRPDRSEWLIESTDSVQVVEAGEFYARVIFRYPGHYTVGFRAYVGDCYKDTQKHITVLEPEATPGREFEEFIVNAFYVYPNPNDGNFHIKVELNKTNPIRLRLISAGTGYVVSDKRYNGQQDYDLPYTLAVSPGVYIVVLETASGYMNVKMIVKS